MFTDRTLSFMNTNKTASDDVHKMGIVEYQTLNLVTQLVYVKIINYPQKCACL